MFFPDETSEESSILLVYDPTTSSASRNPADKSKHLEEVEKDLLKLARDAADVKSELIPVEAKWHSYVAGKDGTTLNAYAFISLTKTFKSNHNHILQDYWRRQGPLDQNWRGGWCGDG